MLTRIITGIILAVVALLAVYFFNDYYFAIFCGLILSLAALEWLKMARIEQLFAKAIYLVLLWALMCGAWFVPLLSAWIGSVWWLFAFTLLAMPLSRLAWMKSRAFLLPAGLLVLVPAWSGIVSIHQVADGHLAVVFVVLVVALSDTGAYFAGSRFGQHKMAPMLSPKKTYEGLIGGVAVSVVAALLLSFFSVNALGGLYYLYIALLALLLVLVGALGDLFESLIKRLSQIKDSGSLLPGHGGVLDRVDSLCAALPVFALFQLGFQIIH